MTYEEMKAEAETAASKLALTRQRGWVMRNPELITRLMTAYCRGHQAGMDKTVKKMAPENYDRYKKLADGEL